MLKKRTTKVSTMTDSKKCAASGKKDSAKAKKIKFYIEAPQASQVAIAGDFNNWSETTLKKTLNKTWEKDISLKPGRYEYKFVIDGNWINDPNNSNTAWNTYGSQNSVIEV
ncbi:MAG: isoamylase early set domain-containing protein [Candidatus Omnitrophica bacterium]|nr:isoamylase early set domain-containing protein [Candidatus Omnitrophota bacterium]